MGNWTPTYLENGACLWLDFSDAANITADAVDGYSIVNDKSGGGAHAYQMTVANRPAYVDWGVNSLKCASFDGSNDSLEGALSQAYTARSFFVVARFPYNNTTEKWFFSDWMTGYAPLSTPTTPCHPLYLVTQYSPRTLRTKQGDMRLNISDDTRLMASHIADGSTVTNRLNGEITGSSGSLSINYTVSNYRIGGLGSATEYPMYGFLGEIIVLPYVATAAERQKVEGYLAWKWGTQGSLPGDHPYRNFAPTETADLRFISYPSSISGGILKVEVGNFQLDTPTNTLEALASNQAVAFFDIVSPSHTMGSSLDPVIGSGDIVSEPCLVGGEMRVQTYGDVSCVSPKAAITGASIGQAVGVAGEISPKQHTFSGQAYGCSVGNAWVNSPSHTLDNGVLLHHIQGRADLEQLLPLIRGATAAPWVAAGRMLQPTARMHSFGAQSVFGELQCRTSTHRVASSGMGAPISGELNSDTVMSFSRSGMCQVTN